MMEHPKCWFAFYVRSRAEKKVAGRFQESGWEYFLPLVKNLRIWSDRKKWVEEPLIKSYIFARVTFPEIHHVVHTDGVSKVIRFAGNPAPIPDKQIENLKIIASSGAEISVTTKEFTQGELVEVKRGALKGVSGMLMEVKGKYKVVMKIDNLDCAVLVTVNANNIKKL
jgi:transcriptional antiterminator RfaH